MPTVIRKADALELSDEHERQALQIAANVERSTGVAMRVFVDSLGAYVAGDELDPGLSYFCIGRDGGGRWGWGLRSGLTISSQHMPTTPNAMQDRDPERWGPPQSWGWTFQEVEFLSGDEPFMRVVWGHRLGKSDSARN